MSTTSNNAASPSGSTGANSGLTEVLLPDGTRVGVAGNANTLPTQTPLDPGSGAPPSPGVMASIGTYGGSISGIMQMLDKWSAVVPATGSGPVYALKSTLNSFFTPVVSNIVAGVSVGLSAYSLWTGLQDMFDKGLTVGNAFTVGMSLVGMVMGATTLLTAYAGTVLSAGIAAGTIAAGATTAAQLPLLFGLAAFPLALVAVAVIAAAMVLITWLMGMSKYTTPSAAELPLTEYPAVSTTGVVLTITIAAALAAVGINLSRTAPVSQVVTMPHSSVNGALMGAGLLALDGRPATPSAPYTETFVKPGDGTTPDQVMIVSPSTTKGYDIVNVYALKNNLHFAATSPIAYIPFFVTGPGGKMIANTDAIAALKAETSLSQAAIALLNPVAQQQAAAANKYTTSTGS